MRNTPSLILKKLATAAALGIAAITAPSAMAQVPPTAAEAAAYTGLHAAAHKG